MAMRAGQEHLRTIKDLGDYFGTHYTEEEFVYEYLLLRDQLASLKRAQAAIWEEERKQAHDIWMSNEQINMIHIDKLKAMTIDDFLREYGEYE